MDSMDLSRNEWNQAGMLDTESLDAALVRTPQGSETIIGDEIYGYVNSIEEEVWASLYKSIGKNGREAETSGGFSLIYLIDEEQVYRKQRPKTETWGTVPAK